MRRHLELYIDKVGFGVSQFTPVAVPFPFPFLVPVPVPVPVPVFHTPEKCGVRSFKQSDDPKRTLIISMSNTGIFVQKIKLFS